MLDGPSESERSYEEVGEEVEYEGGAKEEACAAAKGCVTRCMMRPATVSISETCDGSMNGSMDTCMHACMHGAMRKRKREDGIK